MKIDLNILTTQERDTLERIFEDTIHLIKEHAHGFQNIRIDLSLSTLKGLLNPEKTITHINCTFIETYTVQHYSDKYPIEATCSDKISLCEFAQIDMEEYINDNYVSNPFDFFNDKGRFWYKEVKSNLIRNIYSTILNESPILN